MSYITGSHAFKAGVVTFSGEAQIGGEPVYNEQYVFRNGLPTQLVQVAFPHRHIANVKMDLGIFAQDQWTLRNLTLTIEKGEFVFMTGASGAGKTTLFKLLLRQERPTEGDVVVAGRNLARLAHAEVQAYRRSVGFVFQDFKLIPTKTVFDNVSFALRVLGVPVDQQRRRPETLLDLQSFARPAWETLLVFPDRPRH